MAKRERVPSLSELAVERVIDAVTTVDECNAIAERATKRKKALADVALRETFFALPSMTPFKDKVDVALHLDDSQQSGWILVFSFFDDAYHVRYTQKDGMTTLRFAKCVALGCEHANRTESMVTQDIISIARLDQPTGSKLGPISWLMYILQHLIYPSVYAVLCDNYKLRQ